MRRSPGNRLARLARLALVAGITGMALGACGRPSRPEARKAPASAVAASSGPPLDACALLTPADAREILGGEVAAPTRSVVPGSGETVSQCSYAADTSESPTHPRRFLTLLIRQSPAAPAAYDYARAAAKALTGSDPVEVSGVGEKAYWTGGTFKQLTVLAKNVQLVVGVELGDGRDRVEGTKAVARKVISKL